MNITTEPTSLLDVQEDIAQNFVDEAVTLIDNLFCAFGECMQQYEAAMTNLDVSDHAKETVLAQWDDQLVDSLKFITKYGKK